MVCVDQSIWGPGSSEIPMTGMTPETTKLTETKNTLRGYLLRRISWKGSSLG